MGLPARARERLRLERQHAQVVGDPAAAELRVEARGELVVLGRDPDRVAARLPVVVVAGRAADLAVGLVVLGRVVAHRDQRRGADRDRVGAERERLGDVGAGADPARDDQLHLAVHAELLERVDGEPHGRQRRDADVLDEDVLRRRRAALHAVDDDHVGAGLDRELDVVVGARRADLDEDRLLPVGDLAQLADLDLEVVRARSSRDGGRRCAGRCPSAGRASRRRGRRSCGRAASRRRPASRPGRRRSRSRPRGAGRPGSCRSARGAAGRRAVAECSRSSGVMPPSPVVVDVPTSVAPRPSASFAGAESAPKLMPAIVIGIFSSSGFFAKRVPSVDVRVAALAVALERVARDARAEQEEVVEVRHAPLRAEAADVVDALARRALDLGDHVAVEEVRLAQVPGAARRPSVRARVVDLEGVELRAPSRSGGSPPGRRRRSPARSQQLARARPRCSSRSSFSTQSAPRPATAPRT